MANAAGAQSEDDELEDLGEGGSDEASTDTDENGGGNIASCHTAHHAAWAISQYRNNH